MRSPICTFLIVVLLMPILPAVAAEQKSSTMKRTTITTKIPSVKGKLPTTVAPLTSGECVGLGGKIEDTANCSAAGQKACKTVDHHGVVRVACIDEVKN